MVDENDESNLAEDENLDNSEEEMKKAMQESNLSSSKEQASNKSNSRGQGKVNEILSSIKQGDDALNKLKVQNLDFILDIPLKVSVELGRTKILIKELLQFGQGSVLELDKLSGEPLEILVNGRLIAKGEVVVVNEKFGVKITNIINPIERIEMLK